jgi:hypothetical protein
VKLVKTYLNVPAEYHEFFASLRWSTTGDALESHDGTFALAPEIALFIEGLIGSRRLVHFGYVLHLFALLGPGKMPQNFKYSRCWKIFHETGMSLRNAGALAGQLCREVPAIAEPIELDNLSRRWITNSSLLSLLCAASESGLVREVAESAPWKPAEFDRRICQELARYSDEDLHIWFRHGRGPIPGTGERLANELEALKPRSLAGVLAALTERQRLAGAVPFITQCVSALALPPRRLRPNELPIGGYADVTTRGQPEHLLLSQFAVDNLEFVRRFAANELLYFRREEPRRQLREELVLLLDQGVRTWGDVRLVLSAAVIALGKRAVLHRLPLRVAATSNGGQSVAPLEIDDETLGTLVEASDLSPHPGRALERVLEEPAAVARDVVLLTHPRNLREPNVSAAARRLRPDARLFAVTVDGAGHAELAEFRHGAAVSIAQFRVDLSLKQPEIQTAADAAPNEATGPWSGDIERLAFPFRFGITTPIGPFALSPSGKYLLVSSANGMLHLHQPQGSEFEGVLPRGVYKGEVLRSIHAILGVPAGFVVAGQVGAELVAFHYRLVDHKCVAHVMGAADGQQWQWFYFAAFDSLVVRRGVVSHGVDLNTGERWENVPGSYHAKSRVQEACAEVWKYRTPPPAAYIDSSPPPTHLKEIAPLQIVVLDMHASDLHSDWTRNAVHLHRDSGTLFVGVSDSDLIHFTPLSDGRPALQGGEIVRAQLGHRVLAITTRGPREQQKLPLRLFQLPDGMLLSMFENSFGSGAFALSSNGRWLARQIAPHQIAVHEAGNSGRPLSVTPTGKCHSNLSVLLGDYWLRLEVGERTYLLCWDAARLDIQRFHQDGNARVQQELTRLSLRYPGMPATAFEPPTAWTNLWYDRRRFLRWAKAELAVIVDAFGQVAVFSAAQELMCMMFVFRDQIAAWMPDGTRLGPASITGGPETLNAAEKIGQALHRATLFGKKETA